MLGAIIGDIVGSTREWHNIKTENFELLPEGSHFTDDTVMTLAVAEWLMSDPQHREETLVACMQRLGRKYPDAGYGNGFRRWLESNDPKPYRSFGNGSAMRVSPVGLYAQTMDEALDLARITASVSHNHPEGIKGAQAVAGCVFLRRHTLANRGCYLRRFVEQRFGYKLDGCLSEIRKTYQFDVTCQGSVPIAIMAFLEHDDDAERALRLAVSMGGDSDTIGCMTAAISCAKPLSGGFSAAVVNRCRALLPADLLDINDRFEAFVLNTRREQTSRGGVQSGRVRDRIRGCLMAGAAGDALGYPVEFMRRCDILSAYGRRGITSFLLDRNGKALVSDDTQMTLFTACSLLMGLTRGSMRGIGAAPHSYVDAGYVDWYCTQTHRTGDRSFGRPHTWLRDLPQLAHRRAPGNTCLSACESLIHGKPVSNNSRGCGGIMRVAPVALYEAGLRSRGHRFYDLRSLDEAGAEVAAVTHKHPLGFLPAAMLTHLLYQVCDMEPAEVERKKYVLALDVIAALEQLFPGKYEREKVALARLTRRAVFLAAHHDDDAENIRRLGEGWTGEEAWAIALYCALRHADSVEEAIIAAVNHDGDSDSTGAICGNIMGAIYGYESIRRSGLFCSEGHRLEETLELSDITLALADDLSTGCIISEYDDIDTPEKAQWYARYCQMRPFGI